MNTLIVSICLIVVLLFGVAATVLAFSEMKRMNLHQSDEYKNTEYFLTARNSQPAFRIGWGFYAASIGCSVLFAPSSLIADKETGAGYLGLFSYSLFMGLPLIVAAYLGSFIRSRSPEATSLGSFARWRYGRMFELFVTLQVLFNMSVALAAEYTAIGDLFDRILDTPRLIPVLTIGIVTMIYTIAGGLSVSIITDQWQSIFSLVLLSVVAVYVTGSFHLIDPLPPLPPYLDANPIGYASFLSVGASLMSSTLFSDAIWQRVWSAKDDSSLMTGAIIGAFLTTMVVFLFGFAGFMATWMGLSEDASTAFFQILKNDSGTPVWILTLVCVLATTMNESAVDSFQNALTDTLVSMRFGGGYNAVPLNVARICVVLVNVPIMIVGLQGYKIANLYLITNVLTSCTILPLILGLIPRLDYFVSGASAFFGSIFAILCVCAHGWIVTGTLSQGVYLNFYYVYDWPQFLVAMVSSVLGVFLFSLFEFAVYKHLKLPIPIPHHVKDFDTKHSHWPMK